MQEREHMTNKQFFKRVSEKEFTDEVISFATEQFEKIIQKENARKANSERSRQIVLELFDDKAHSASEIASMSKSSPESLSTQKVSAACRTLVERGLLERIEPEKRNAPVQYRRVISKEEE